jgi:peptidoglycan hydrolase-like protein with peptidoglycan-binding domain
VIRSRKKVLGVVCGVAVVSMGLGVAAGTRLTSPADAAARTKPPAASNITVPVERKALNNQVVTRADASFEGAVDIKLQPTGEGKAVVTGQVPKVGSRITEGKPLLEVTGRPVIALAGELPMYRALRPGMQGPDVKQLEQTLHRLGYDTGVVDEKYDARTSSAVAKLFRDAGYEPPQAEEALSQAVDRAQEALDTAEEQETNAERALENAQAGPTRTQRVQAENAVEQAERALAEAKRSGDQRAISEATAQLKLAKAQLADLLEPKDTSAEREALDSAQDRVDEAEETLAEAKVAAGTPLPISEVVFVRSLPRRVDSIEVKRGSEVGTGAVMSVSGADLVVTATVDPTTKSLLRKDMAATIHLVDGQRVPATITRIDRDDDAEEGTQYEVVITPKKLTAQQLDLLRSANVRVTVPVRSTKGKVLAVPVAALSAGPGGESRVEVMRGGKRTLVEVEVGLSAEGYAEVRPVSGDLKAGDQVVVGR